MINVALRNFLVAETDGGQMNGNIATRKYLLLLTLVAGSVQGQDFSHLAGVMDDRLRSAMVVAECPRLLAELARAKTVQASPGFRARDRNARTSRGLSEAITVATELTRLMKCEGTP